ncbi:MAG: RNA polymerase sigma factor [Gemmatimonadetes bacterium]|nr:RNA polymerase sigma factor [Gemmatimonadota bacterium]MYE69837.1 RNA polymerase sigma factor [Gemmatimonadota bacterium]MYJ67168.1 RNA polymerase sigma factor [Gemmatimonadota bacterium]
MRECWTSNRGSPRSRCRTRGDRPLDRGPDATARIAEWARSYRHRLALVALQLVGNEDDAEDVVQDVLARELSHALADPQTLDGVSNPYGRLAWLTRNAARDAWRKQARRARILRDNDTEVREQLRPAPDLGWDVDWLCQRVRDVAARTLTGKQLRMARKMMAGRTDAQIARDEGVARSTVRWHRREAARSIREYIAGEEGLGRTPGVRAVMRRSRRPGVTDPTDQGSRDD